MSLAKRQIFSKGRVLNLSKNAQNASPTVNTYISLIGGDKLKAVLRKLQREWPNNPKIVEAAMTKGARALAQKANTNAKSVSRKPAKVKNKSELAGIVPNPVRYWRAEGHKRSEPKFNIGAISPYFHLNILEGFWPTKGPYPMPKGGGVYDKPLVFTGTNGFAGKRVVTKSVKNHPPPAPRPWLRRSLIENEDFLVAKVRDAIRDAMDDNLRKHGV